MSNKFMDLLTGQTGKTPDELQEFADLFKKLAERGKALGINFKALVDEDSGARVEIDELAGAVAERVTALLADRGVEVADDIVQAIADEVMALFPEPTPASEEAPPAEEMRQWVEKSVRLVEGVMDVKDDIAVLTEEVAALRSGVEAVTKAVGAVERQLRARKPASQARETVADVPPEEVIEQLKAQIAAELKQRPSGVVPAGTYEY
jgi:hypothetical protein